MAEKLLERLIRHQLHVQRYGGSQVKKAMPIIRALARDVRQRIQSASLTEFQADRLAALERDLQFIAAQHASSIRAALDLEDFAAQEAAFTKKLLGAAVAVDLGEGITPEQVRAVVTRSQMTLISGKRTRKLTLRQAFDEFADGVGRDALRVVQAGNLEGRTQQQMARDVAALVQTRSRRQAETLVRTATNHIGAAARNMVYQENSDIMQGERFVATLDGNTTVQCLSVEVKQEIYPIGQGPIPPLHWGCRSLRVPVVKPEYRLAPHGERASMDGPVSGQMTYSGFLRKQSAEFQDSVLGPERAKLFRSGEVSLDRFTDDAGRVLSLDELRQAESLDLA